jgi:diguanylate cyclase (GGDEF)-like protein
VHAVTVADKLRVMVEERQFPGVSRPVTISAGAASYPDDGTTRDELVKAADAGLYAAKQAGRNRVFKAPESGKSSGQATGR